MTGRPSVSNDTNSLLINRGGTCGGGGGGSCLPIGTAVLCWAGVIESGYSIRLTQGQSVSCSAQQGEGLHHKNVLILFNHFVKLKFFFLNPRKSGWWVKPQFELKKTCYTFLFLSVLVQHVSKKMNRGVWVWPIHFF